MERQEVVDFILAEAKRLNEEEHIHDLCKAERYEELSQVECKISNAVSVYLDKNNFYLKDYEIPNGSYLAIAIWVNTVAFENTIEDEKKFAKELAEEAGKLGKSIAWKIIKDNQPLSMIPWEEFFDDGYANKYKAG